MDKIVRFEIQADDLERSAQFYPESFGRKINEWLIPVFNHKL